MQEEEKRPEEPLGYVPNSMGKRVAAMIGVILMVLLVLLFTYSIATGGIFAW